MPGMQTQGGKPIRIQRLETYTLGDLSFVKIITDDERRINMMRAFNAREGIDSRQDKLPEKFFKRGEFRLQLVKVAQRKSAFRVCPTQ